MTTHIRPTALITKGVLLIVLALIALAVPAKADPTWTTYNPDTCTITITPSGRTAFQVTIGGEVTVHDLSDHQPVTLDVNGEAWSVAVERDTAGGWVTVISGDAITCGDDTTTTTEPPTTTTEPPPSTTQPPVTTTSFIDACDDSECPEPPDTTRPPRDTTTTTEAPAPPTTEPPSAGPTDDTLPVTGPAEDLQGVAVLAGLLLLTGGGIAWAEARTRKADR